MVEDRAVGDTLEVLGRPPGPARVAQRLEVLLGPPRQARLREGLADEGAPAAGRGADQVRALRGLGHVASHIGSSGDTWSTRLRSAPGLGGTGPSSSGSFVSRIH